MKERPILFSGEMVRAILEGRKTQTRRVVKPMPTYHYDHWQFKGATFHTQGMTEWLNTPYPNGEKCPYGLVGDRLWVRETFMLESWTREFGDTPPIPTDRPHQFTEGDYDNPDVWEWPHYAATDEKPDLVDLRGSDEKMMGWSPSIHMPRWASRLNLEIVGVRVERLQDISNNDALAEGTPDIRTMENNYDMRNCFRELWDKINAKRGFGWDKNPWVWVIEFRRVEEQNAHA